jgi:hypothetical protein
MTNLFFEVPPVSFYLAQCGRLRLDANFPFPSGPKVIAKSERNPKWNVPHRNFSA